MWLLAAAALVLTLACARASSGKSPAARNVVLVTLDTLRADRLGAYGNPGGASPRFDALSHRGVLYENAFTTAPVTLPAHVSLFSGLLPSHSGVRVNGTDRVPAGTPLLAEELRRSGFATGAFVGSFVLRSETGVSRGFDLFDEKFAANAGRTEALLAERPGSEVVDRALSWLDGVGSNRFFLWVHLFDPHAPYAPLGEYARRFPGRPYEGEIAATDASLGRLMDGLRARGTLDATLVVVAGDHGESLGEHGEKTHGVFLYDATMRVPLLVVPPGGGEARRVGAPVSLVDVAPTIREAAGLPPVASDGVSLSGPVSEDRVVFAESSYPAVLLGWSPLRAARSRAEKYVEAPRPEFYELSADPAEARNVYDAAAEPVRRLARAMSLRRSQAPVLRADAVAGDPEAARRLASLGYLTPRHPDADLERIDATRVDPKDRIRWWDAIERGIVAGQAGRAAEAAAVLGGLVRDYPEEDPVLLRELATALRRSGRPEQAILVYERVLARFPAVAEDHFGLGVSWHARGRADLAARALERAVALDPAHEDAWINLGQEYLAVDALARAQEAFGRAARLDGRSVDALAGLAAVAYARKDFAAAAQKLREALAIEPGDPQTIANLQQVERAMGQRVRAQG